MSGRQIGLLTNREASPAEITWPMWTVKPG